MAYNSFSFSFDSLVYIGSFNKLTQVLVLGKRLSSVPESRIQNFGRSCEKPSKGALGVELTYFSRSRRCASVKLFTALQNNAIVGCSRPSVPISYSPL